MFLNSCTCVCSNIQVQVSSSKSVQKYITIVVVYFGIPNYNVPHVQTVLTYALGPSPIL